MAKTKMEVVFENEIDKQMNSARKEALSVARRQAWSDVHKELFSYCACFGPIKITDGKHTILIDIDSMDAYCGEIVCKEADK